MGVILVQNPLVSVLMAVYNDAKWLDDSIPSILSQSLVDFEFIIINDGSTDTTCTVLEEWAARDPRIVVRHLPTNGGLARALNLGLSLVRASLVARHDADDIAMPDRLIRQVAYLETHPEVVVVGTNAIAIDGDGNNLGSINTPQSPEMIRKVLRWTTPFVHPSVMYRRDVILRLGGYDESLLRSQDYDLWFRLLAQYKGANLSEVLLKYRVYPDGYKKRKLRFRIQEARLRWRGLKAIGAAWWEYLFVTKPLLVGLIPKEALRHFHIFQWRRSLTRARSGTR